MKSQLAFLGAAALAQCGVVYGALQATPAKPNIVLIMADDFGYECIGANGCQDYSTPHVDRLARQGIRFEQCFANPLCTPSRVKIMTGQYNVRNYLRFGCLERSQTTFAHQLKKAGYATVISGKWQLGGETDSPQHFGFDQACLWQHTRGRTRKGTSIETRYENPRIEVNGKPVDYSNGEFGPDVFADFVDDFIEKNQHRPFFVYYPLVLTHCPFVPTPDTDEYDPKSPGASSYKGPGTVADQRRHFAQMTHYTDKMVGRVMAQLEKLNLTRNTLVIFTGDNGTDAPIVTRLNGQRIRGGKGSMNERGTRVPLIVSWPGKIRPGVNSKDLVEFSDFLPTLCEVAGAPLPDRYPGDGVSFYSLLTGGKNRVKDYIYIWYNRKTWVRNLDCGVLKDDRKKCYEYQRFDGLYQPRKVKFEQATPEEQKTFLRFRKIIEDMEQVPNVRKR